MLNFRNTNILFSLMLIVLIGVHIKYGLPVYGYLLLLFAYSLLVFYGCYYIGSQFFIKVISTLLHIRSELHRYYDVKI